MNLYSNVPSVILVVDDSTETLGLLNTALSQAGMTVLVSLNGEQALDIARKMAPDIVLLDAIMPCMHGFEVCKKFKADTSLKDIPIIFMTGLSDTPNIVKGFDSGGVDYITKPINPSELLARIQVHLDTARATDSVKTALDVSGQSVFSVNAQGVLLWSTPKVQTLFNQSKFSDLMTSTIFKPEISELISQWVERCPSKGDTMTPLPKLKNFKFAFLGLARHQEFLIKIEDNDQFSEQENLMKNLSITAREADVLTWVAKGKTNREIGKILDLSPRTVNKHLEQLFKKLGVDNRTSAAACALPLLQNS